MRIPYREWTFTRQRARSFAYSIALGGMIAALLLQAGRVSQLENGYLVLPLACVVVVVCVRSTEDMCRCLAAASWTATWASTLRHGNPAEWAIHAALAVWWFLPWLVAWGFYAIASALVLVPVVLYPWSDA